MDDPLERISALLDACPEPNTPEEGEWLREHYSDWKREFDSEVLQLRQNGGNNNVNEKDLR